MSTDAQSPQLNPWRPMRRAVDLKHLGKLIEELSEASAAASRCVIQGIDECEPVSGKSNRGYKRKSPTSWQTSLWSFCIFGLDKIAIEARVDHKCNHLKKWHGMLDEE